MWLGENIKLHASLLPMACILFLLDSTGLESEAKKKYGPQSQAALRSKPNCVFISFVNRSSDLTPVTFNFPFCETEAVNRFYRARMTIR